MIHCKSLQTIVLSAIVLTAGWLFEHTAAHAGTPIGTAITYQGRLDDTGAPASGNYDFKFSIYDALTAGTQIGSTLMQTITVTDGIFNTTLDFGAGAFTGDARYLEIEVQPNGGGGYTTLTPRQLLSTVPHATYAASIEPVANIVWVAKSGGDYATIGEALTAITASDTDRYLIRIGPGVYEETIDLESYVDIEGSGRGITIIRGTGGGYPLTDGSSATLRSTGAINAEVRQLTVESVGIGVYATAIWTKDGGAALRITDVDANASGGGSFKYGVFNYSSSPIMTHVTATGTGGSGNFGVLNSDSSSPEMTHVKAAGTGGSSSYGVGNFNSSSPEMTHVKATGSGASSFNIGVYNLSSSSPVMNNVMASAAGGGDSRGIYNFVSSVPTIRGSTITGATNSILNEASSGAMVYTTGLSGQIGNYTTCLYSYNSDNGKPVNGNCQEVPYAIGDVGPAGGIVFYVTDGGLHGLEAAPSDSADSSWGCYGTGITGADGFVIGTGAQNTADIVAGCADAGIAAKVANNYSLNSFTDWFLPSYDESYELYLQQGVVGGFSTINYWSSTESQTDPLVFAAVRNFDEGYIVGEDKDLVFGVRAVRAF